MPGGNGTGPEGLGPMTGRAMGYCVENSVPGYANRINGRGFRGRAFGRGRGIGARNWNAAINPYAPYPYSNPETTPENEIETLKDQAKFMQKDVTAINDRIKELENIIAQKKKS